MKKLTRRDFLKIGSASAVALSGVPTLLNAMELSQGEDYSPITLKKMEVIPTTCLQCNMEDGLLCFVEDGMLVKIEGNPKHPATRGRICAKGNAGINTVYNPDRLLYPIKREGTRGEGKWKRIAWDEALNEIAEKIKEIRLSDPGEIMFHYGRDRTHGYTKRFMAAIGSNTIGNHTSICESSKKEGMERTWGPDIETPDFENTKYIINFGSNIYEAAYFHNPYLQRIIDGRVNNHAKLVTFDVRLSNTAGRSDEWHPIFPGTDGIVALALANVIMQEGLADTNFINEWTNVTADELKNHLSKYTPEYAEGESGVPAKDIRRIAIEFAKNRPRCTTYSYRGPAMHLNGSYNEKCQMLLNIIVGNIDKEGGYCMPRGMKFKHPEPEPKKPETKSVLANPPEYPLAHHHVSHHIAQGILEGKQKISMYIWYMYNPLYCNPDSGTWEALFKDTEKMPFLVAIDGYITESSQYADIILPDSSYLQRHDPENMPSCLLPWVSARVPVVPNLGEQREIRDILRDLAGRIGEDVAQYFKETPEEYLAYQMNSIDGLKEVGGLDFIKKHGVWPIYDPADVPKFETYKEKGFKSSDSGSEDGKIHIKVSEWEKYGFEPLPYYWPIEEHREIREGKSNKLIMTTFKVNVHTQSRTSSCKWLSEISHSNPLWINPKTAENMGINDGDLVRVTSKIGYLVTRAHLTEGIHPKVVAIPTSSGHTKYGPVAEAKRKEKNEFGSTDSDVSKNLWWKDTGVHPNKIVPVSTDPIGGGQAWFDTVVSVEKAQPGDKYGDIHTDLEGGRLAYLETLKWTTKVKVAEEHH